MFHRRKFRLRLPSRALMLGGRTLVMGVLNVTPDSFSDGGLFLDTEAAVARAIALEAAGADIVDVGGESTRPGSSGISLDAELRRVIPVIEGLRGKIAIPISVDTSKSEVAEAAAAAGAEIVNDVTALRNDREIADVARRRKLPLILMHMRGQPATMQKKPFARDALRDVTQGLRRAVAIARRAGVAKSQIILDPGIGFGKSYEQNCELLARLPELARLGFPILVGTSRKSFIGGALKSKSRTPLGNQRIWGTAATVAASILQGAHIIRVHDVAEMAQVAQVSDAILSPRLLRRQARRKQ
jgi:dihydropteroate synthase